MAQENKKTLVFWLSLFIFVVIARSAWVSDDAYITFRSIENFLAGYGLGFNPYVRVQSFTHPLWMLVVSLLYYLLKSAFPISLYLVVIFLSLIFSITAIYILLLKISPNETIALFFITIALALSKAFVDFSSSGLENPLTHLLLVLFILLFYKIDDAPPFSLSFLSGLIVLNRMDAFILIFPALFLSWYVHNRSIKGILVYLFGFAPFILWEIFSVIYFGFPFPNTAYAKLNTGVDAYKLVFQGLDYVLNVINWSPVTFFTIVALVFIYTKISAKAKSLYFGVILYICYVVSIGGDFMSGRFFSAPFLISVAVLSNEVKHKKEQIVLIALILLLGLFSVRSPLLAPSVYNDYSGAALLDSNGIADERLFYINQDNEYSFVEHGFRDVGYYKDFVEREWEFFGFRQVVIANMLGREGYSRGPNVFITDSLALSDPLLARLPIRSDYWRIGHFERIYPDGYLETLISNNNVIHDESLSLYYSKLKIVVEGSVWSRDRFIEIWKINTGQYDYLLEEYLSQIK